MSVKIKDFSDVEYVLPGSAACAGCPSTIALRIVGKALGENAIMLMTPPVRWPASDFSPNPATPCLP